MNQQSSIQPARLAAQSHFRTLRLASPFQPRIDALMKTEEWYNWAGYKAPGSLWDEELEYFAIRSQAALFDISPMVKYRIEGPEAEAGFAEPEQRTVVEHIALVVAPGGVVEATGLQLRDVAQGQPVEEGLGVRPGDAVLRHRRDVEQRGLAADRELFELLVPQRARRAVARPIVPLLRLHQRVDARLEG